MPSHDCGGRKIWTFVGISIGRCCLRSNAVRDFVSVSHQTQNLSTDRIKALTIRRGVRAAVDCRIGSDVARYQAFATILLLSAEPQGLQMNLPWFVALLRIACFAARQEVAKSMAMSTERAVFYGCMDVIPRFGGLATIGTGEVTIWIIAEQGNSFPDPGLVISIVGCDRRCEHVVDRRFAVSHHAVWLEVRSDGFDAHSTTVQRAGDLRQPQWQPGGTIIRMRANANQYRAVIDQGSPARSVAGNRTSLRRTAPGASSRRHRLRARRSPCLAARASKSRGRRFSGTGGGWDR